jgi:hypothetical protein
MTNPRTDDELREQVCEWLRSNGIDPKDIPIDARMSWTNGRLTTDVILRNAAGRAQIDPDNKNQVARAPWRLMSRMRSGAIVTHCP